MTTKDAIATLERISKVFAGIDDDDLTQAERTIKRLIQHCGEDGELHVKTSNKIERVIQNRKGTALLVVVRTVEGYDVRRFYASSHDTYRLQLFSFKDRTADAGQGPWTRVLRRRAIEYAIEKSRES